MSGGPGAERDLIEAGLNETADAATRYGISAGALSLGMRWIAARCRCSRLWRAILRWIPALQSGAILRREASRVFRRLLSVRRSYDDDKEQVFA